MVSFNSDKLKQHMPSGIPDDANVIVFAIPAQSLQKMDIDIDRERLMAEAPHGVVCIGLRLNDGWSCAAIHQAELLAGLANSLAIAGSFIFGGQAMRDAMIATLPKPR